MMSSTFFLPAVTIGSFLILIPLLIKNIVLEKETGGKELMRMMGYRNWMLWFGWLLNTLTVCCFSAAMISFLMVTDAFCSGPIFQMLDGSVLFVFLLLYCLVIIFFCFALSPIFSTSVKAMFWGIIVWTVTCGVPELMFKRSSYKNLISFAHLFLPNAVLIKGWQSIIYLERKGYGVTWDTIFLEPSDGKTYSLITIFYIFGLHCLVLCIAAWYLDSICPGPFGASKPWNFFLKCSFWRTSSLKSLHMGLHETKYGWNEAFELPSKKLQVGLQVRNLQKAFCGVSAVENLNLDLYKDQITVLLGHNGAGKTTVMSMLTGMLSPSSGEVIVNDVDILKSPCLFRENLGLCPQHNLLFSYLTVLEHLIFFGMMKKLSKSEATVQGMQLLKFLLMESKKDARPTHLSGGMKRKLSLAIALMGSPKILMLDEPTSGMDPESRREMWDLLLTLRENRTILITTHHLEEAEALGDQIAIMSKGSVKCYGSLMFLKKKFGACFYLKVNRENLNFDTNALTSLIQQSISNAILHSENSSQLIYKLPIESIEQFPDMLAKLEHNQGCTGISNFSISSASLEEVFIKVGEENENQISAAVEDSKNFSMHTSNGHYKREIELRKMSQFSLFRQHFMAFLVKKWKFTRRKCLFYLFFGALPILMGFAACVNMNAYMSEQIKHFDALTLSLNGKVYGGFIHYRSYLDTPNTAIMFKNLVKPPLTTKEIPTEKNVFRYLLNIGESDMIKYFNEHVGAVEFRENKTIVIFNQHMIHSLPILLNLVYNSVSQTKLERFQITTSVQPIFRTDPFQKAFEEQKRKLTLLFMWVVVFASSIMTFAGCFILFPHTERVNFSKQLQMMTGASPFTYWLSSFIVDYCYTASVLAVTLASIYLFDQYGILSHSPEFDLLVVAVFLYGFVAVLFAYVCSYFQTKFATAFFTYFVISTVLGSICACVIFNFQELDYYFRKSSLKMTIAHYILLLLPHYSISMILFNYIFVAWNNKCRFRLIETEDPCIERDYWVFRDGDEKQYGVNGGFVAVVLDIFFYILIIICLEMNVFKKLNHIWSTFIFGSRLPNIEIDAEDFDVHQEKKIVEYFRKKNGLHDSVLMVDNLQKKFSRNFTAVRGVNFIVKPGECFGVLGVNGAGKTTTFRLLTGDLIPTQGDCVALDTRMSLNSKKYQSHIGYCPQFDALNEVLTAEEILTLFATLRGISQSEIEKEVNFWLSELNLESLRSRRCGYFSGGVKRRLSTAAALIGDPKLVVLDEPTSGVDPVSRRNLWSALMKCRRKGQSIIVTSHSMDECEEICDRLTIMVSGKMKCIGSIPHLKKKFGQGYTVMIKLKLPHFGKVEVCRLKDAMESLFVSKIVLKDEHLCLLNYHVTDPKVPLSELYSKLLSIQNRFSVVEDFTISETTLEQVFIAFAKNKVSIKS
ncbi:unnamed protein product [Bemisia tabaci]|uniref:ABC transporter domain-containing protein n=2 Tax=Bemisia tabaci TaxID=7038 RepID=A0AAI8Y5U7_BEMTA|nr:unnamed protein product [Bemisia tabaci]